MTWFLISLLVAAPLVAGTVAARLGARARWAEHAPAGTAVAVLAALASVSVTVLAGRPSPAAGPFVLDGVALLVGSVVAFVAMVVLAFARRNLRGTPGAARFWAWSGLVLTATLLTSFAAGPAVLALGWIATSIGVVGLVGHRRTTRSSAAARATGRALLLGDVSLLAAVAIVVGIGGAGSFAEPVPGALGDAALVVPFGPTLSWGALAALLLLPAALVRAGSPLLPSWLPRTVDAPTPVSALLHAGVVNAGAVLLLRFGGVLGDQALAAWLLGGAAAVGTVLALLAARGRQDVKGELAASTSAQMGFMLLAVAAAVPAAALAHLVGHALYKSTRFLAAGGVPTAATAARRHDPTRARPAPSPVVVRVAAASATAAVVVGTLSLQPGLDGAKAWFLLLPVAAVLDVGLERWLRASGRPLPVALVVGLLGGAAAVALVLVGGAVAEAAVGQQAVPATGPSAPALLLVLVALVAAATLAGRHREVGAALLGLGRRAGPTGSPTAAPVASGEDRGALVLRSAW